MPTRRQLLVTSGLATALLLAGGMTASTSGETTTLVIESWRADDMRAWNETLIPAFEAAHPNIKVEFSPTQQDQYDATLATKFAGGTAGDIIACRPYDTTRVNAEAGHLQSIDGLAGLANFDATTLAAWQGDDGAQYCMPAAAVGAGIYYNVDALTELGIAVPTTMDEFMAALETIKQDGNYDPIAQGTASAWDLSALLFNGIGANYYHGETGRLGLIDGTLKMTDPTFIEALTVIESFRPYFPSAFKSLTVDDSAPCS